MFLMIPDEEFAHCEPCDGHMRDVVLASHILAFDDNLRDFAESAPCDNTFTSHEDMNPENEWSGHLSHNDVGWALGDTSLQSELYSIF